MSRLERHRRKQTRKNVYVFLGIMVLFFILAFNVVVPLVINSSVFVANLFNSGAKKTAKIKDQVFGRVEIIDIPSATNSAAISFSGFVEGYDTITVYLNDSKIKKLDTEGDPNFTTEIDGLSAGDNEVYILASKVGESNKRTSAKYTVTFKQDKPKLEDISPEDNYRTPRDEITVSGKTDTGNTVRVNGSLIILNSTGTFQTAVKLNEGENKIKITASDPAGNIEEKTITVIYEK